MPTLTATLTSNGAPVPAGAIPVDRAGVVVGFTVPADSELVAARLTVVAPADDRTIDLRAGPDAATIASSAGPGAPPRDLAVDWISLDWRVRRSLVALSVGVTGATTATAGQLKLAEDGPWYPPTPARLTLGAAQRLPSLTATRLLVEFVAGTAAAPTPSTAIVTGVTLLAAARPADLTVALGGDPPLASHQPPFDPREVWSLETALLDALVAALGDRGGPVALRLASSAPGQLHRLDLAIDRVPLVRRFAGGDAAVLAVPAGSAAAAPIPVPAAAVVQSLGFTVAAEFPRERPAVAAADAPPGPHAHRVTPTRTAAQGFAHAPGAALAGVDVQVRPLAAAVQASLAIHADQFGAPAEAALVTVPLERMQDGDPPWPTQWWSFAVDGDLPLPDGPWWVCLAVAQGDLLWHLDSAAPPDAPAAPLPAAAKFRNDADAWLPREVPGPGPVRSRVVPWARTRVRLRQPGAAAPPAPTLLVRWRGKQVPVTPDEHGRVELTPAQLATFTGDAPGPLEIVAACDVAGTVTLTDLRVRLAQVRDTLGLGLALDP